MMLNSSIMIWRTTLCKVCENSLPVLSRIQPSHALATNRSKENFRKKYKEHEGIFHRKRISIPPRLKHAFDIVCESYPEQDILNDVEELRKVIPYRQQPLEINQMRRKAIELEEEFSSAASTVLGDLNTSAEEREKTEDKIRRRVFKALRRSNIHFRKPEWDKYRSLLYARARLSAEFAVLSRVFYEMKQRIANFSPVNMFDFGSGVGSAVWAANTTWPGALQEHYTVDESGPMNDLAMLLLRGGRENKEPCFPYVYQRQFAPKRMMDHFDIVVSSYSLLELQSASVRRDTLKQLWKNTRHFLVLVESAHLVGFEVLAEARQFILEMLKEENQPASLVAPCPHTHECPVLTSDLYKKCSAVQSYQPYSPNDKFNTLKLDEYFSYLILQKGDDFEVSQRGSPRMIRDSQWRSKCVTCHICSSDAKCQQVVFSRSKTDRDLLMSSRYTRAGDLLKDTSNKPQS